MEWMRDIPPPPLSSPSLSAPFPLPPFSSQSQQRLTAAAFVAAAGVVSLLDRVGWAARIGFSFLVLFIFLFISVVEDEPTPTVPEPCGGRCSTINRCSMHSGDSRRRSLIPLASGCPCLCNQRNGLRRVNSRWINSLVARVWFFICVWVFSFIFLFSSFCRQR